MGADLYIRSLNDRCKAEHGPKFERAVKIRDALPRDSEAANAAQQAVEDAYSAMYAEGYFRDCYNGYGLFAQFPNLSWWRDVIPLCDDDRNLPIEKARELRTRIASEKLCLAAARKVAKEQHDPPPKLKEYESWRGELLALLDKSIEMNEPIHCSL